MRWKVHIRKCILGGETSYMIIRQITKEETWPIRQLVMWPNKPIEYCILENDEVGFHYGVYIDNHDPVSVISLFVENGVAQFRKFATRQEEQGKGYGTALLNFAIHEAKKQGCHTIWCNARKLKASFYETFGLVATHDEFMRGNIAYVKMEKSLI